MRRSSLGTLEVAEIGKQPKVDFNAYKHTYSNPYVGHKSHAQTKMSDKPTSRREYSRQFVAKYGSPIRESPLVELRTKVKAIENNNIGEKAKKTLLRFIDF